MLGFELDKWYADVVAPDGAGAIVYHASLRWRGIALAFGELLLFRPGGSIARRTTLRPGPQPRLVQLRAECSRLTAEISPLDVQARWDGLSPGVTITLWDCAAGQIHWNCCVPAARVDGVFAGTRLAGKGYAERLVMTLPPWDFPSEELRWGRVVGDRSWAAWIGWSGGVDRSWVVDGQGRVQSGSVSDAHVAAGGVRVELEPPSLVIRDEELGRSLRGPAALLRALVPRRVLGVHETKWLARASLAADAAACTERTWAIHEVVRMGRRGA